MGRNKKPKNGKVVKALAQHRKIKFLHPKKTISAFGNKMNKPAGTDFSFEDYVSKKKKKKIKGDAAMRADDVDVNVGGDERQEVAESKRKNSINLDQIFGKEHASRIEKFSNAGSSKKKSIGLDMNGNPSPGTSKQKAVPYSVEEAVADQIGCRPRSNSTDNELNLPRKG